MALEIINSKIVGTIEDLEEKLDGKIPIDRLELLYLVNSWGRSETLVTNNNNVEIKIEISKCQATQSEQTKFVRTQSEQALLVRKECYDLSKLDVSQITNMDRIFKHSLFTDIHSTNGIGLHNGDISKWDVSNVTSMKEMFFCAENFNQDIGNWDVFSVTNMDGMFFDTKYFNQDISNWNVSNVTNMNGMFYESKNFNSDISKWDVSNVKDIDYMFAYTKAFNQNISSWNLKNIINCDYMFNNSKAFIDKYNSGEPLPKYTDNIKDWVNLNRDRMNEIDIKLNYGKKINDFFSIINEVYSINKK